MDIIIWVSVILITAYKIISWPFRWIWSKIVHVIWCLSGKPPSDIDASIK